MGLSHVEGCRSIMRRVKLFTPHRLSRSLYVGDATGNCRLTPQKENGSVYIWCIANLHVLSLSTNFVKSSTPVFIGWYTPLL